MAIPKPMSPSEWLAQQYPDEMPGGLALKRAIQGGEDDSTNSYAGYLQSYNSEMFGDVTDPYGNTWSAPGQAFGLQAGEEGYSVTGGESYDSSQYADLVQGLEFTNEKGVTYIPQVIANQIAERNRGGSFVQNWLNGPGPVIALATLGYGAIAGAGAGAAAGAAEGATVTGAGGAGLGAADSLGLQQMAAAAGLPPGSAASEAFIASGGTMGSTAAGGLGGAGSLAESFGYPAVTGETGGIDWWQTFKDIAGKLPGPPGPNLPVQPLDVGAGAADLGAADLGAAGVSPETASTALADAPLPVVPKPGAPDYQQLWSQYSGWIDNVNRINEGAFADVRARLSAAGAAPELIKMQTEHLESQRVQAVQDLGTSETFKLLDEGYGIAMGSIENRYEGGLEKYAGPGKPELMDFYTEKYGQPTRAPGAGGTIGSGGTPPASSQAAANPWFDDSGRASLIG